MNIPRSLIFILFCLAGADNAASKDFPPKDEIAIQKALAVKPVVVRASWWGFNPADSTATLQAAIDSGAEKLIIENMEVPWITEGLRLASDQEIVFESGVVVLAKRGAFKRGTDSLFSAEGKHNITLTGEKATLRMWKEDYADAAKYSKAEWRNVIMLRSCSQVKITGLTLADSGGDGIYLGASKPGVPCSDVTIQNVVCDNNYRQGISVISARNLLIENCVLKNTSGTAPESGIDFEPNAANEELTNCEMRNCVSENNKGRGFLFALPHLHSDSAPLSIRLENCRSSGDSRAVELATANRSDTAGVKGKIEFVDCEFENSVSAAILIRDKTVTAAQVRFERCTIVDPAKESPETTPIQFGSNALGADTFGGIHFEKCSINDSVDRLPMSYSDLSGGVGLADITGTLLTHRDGHDTTYELTPNLIAEWMPFRSFKRIGHFESSHRSFEPVVAKAATGFGSKTSARQRGLSEWFVWSDGSSETVSFDVEIIPVGKTDPLPVPVSIISPSGKLTKLEASPGAGITHYDFATTEIGTFTVVCEARNWTATVNSQLHPTCLYSQSSAFHLLGTVGEFFFWVPSGTKEFAVKVSGGGGSEQVKASVINPQGETVELVDNISRAHQFVVSTIDKSAQGQIWSIRLDRPSIGLMEDFQVQLQGIPAVLAHTREDLLKPVSKGE